MLNVRVVEASSVEELAGHASAWDDLALAAAERRPMLSYAWVASVLENDQFVSPWRCLLAYEGDRLLGVLPVRRVRERIPGVRLSGTMDPRLHTYSSYPLLEARSAQAALSALLGELRVVEPQYLWLRLGGVRDNAVIRSIEELQGAELSEVPAAHWRRSASILPVRGSFEDYERGLSTNFRRNLRKARNRSERDHDVSFRFVTGPDASSKALLHRFLDLESAGWKGRAGTSIARTPHLVQFYSALCERMSRRGWLEWHFLDLDGRTVAGHLGIRFGRSLVLLKIAYDEAQARLGPGSLLFHETVVRAFAGGGVDGIDCLSDTAWHRNWHMSTAPYSDMVVTPSRPVPRLAALVEVRGAALARRTASRGRRAAKHHAAKLGVRPGPR